MDPRSQKALRITFVSGLLLYYAYSASFTEQVRVLNPGECLRDMTYVWSEPVNIFLRDNLDIKDLYMMFGHFMMDIMMLSFLITQALYWRTSRVFWGYLLFFGLRTYLQLAFSIGRPEGFLYFFPGQYSITVPYPDINDFFFSGHVGTCTLLILEYYSMGWYKCSYFCVFVMVNQWILMMLVRTHFIIDLVTGLILAHYFFMWAE